MLGRNVLYRVNKGMVRAAIVAADNADGSADLTVFLRPGDAGEFTAAEAERGTAYRAGKIEGNGPDSFLSLDGSPLTKTEPDGE